MIKAVFFDIDGTLVSHTASDIPADTIEALDILREKGILLFIATGRHISEFKDLPLHDYPFDGYVTQTGQLCYDRDFKPLVSQPFPDKDAQTLINCFVHNEIPMVLLNEHSLYINYINDDVIRTQKAINTSLPPIGEYQGEKLYGATVFGDDLAINKIIERLNDCRESRWNEYAVDIVLGQDGKVSGIRKMLEIYGLKKSEIIAFGDADNDINMIQYAGTGIAMGNATPALKEAADYITSSVDDGGIKKALQFFKLL